MKCDENGTNTSETKLKNSELGDYTKTIMQKTTEYDSKK